MVRCANGTLGMPKFAYALPFARLTPIAQSESGFWRRLVAPARNKHAGFQAAVGFLQRHVPRMKYTWLVLSSVYV